MAKLRGNICKPEECGGLKLASSAIEKLKAENEELKTEINEIGNDRFQTNEENTKLSDEVFQLKQQNKELVEVLKSVHGDIKLLIKSEHVSHHDLCVDYAAITEAIQKTEGK